MNLEIRRDGWPMKVMEYGGLDADDRTDLCAAFWAFVWGLIRAPFWVVLLGLIGSGIGYTFVLSPVIGIIAYFAEGVAPDFWTYVGMSAWFAFGVIAHEAWAEDRGRARIGSAVGAAVNLTRVGYRSWKDKTCVLIDVRG